MYQDKFEISSITIFYYIDKNKKNFKLNVNNFTFLQTSKKDEKSRVEGLRNRFVPPDGGFAWFVAFGNIKKNYYKLLFNAGLSPLERSSFNSGSPVLLKVTESFLWKSRACFLIRAQL